jgi:two-component system OmpR family sensor kinase
VNEAIPLTIVGEAAQPQPKAGPAGIASLLPKTLTGRLVAGVVALVILLVLVIGSSTYVALRSFLYSRLDQQVASIARQNEGSITDFLNDPRLGAGGQGPTLIYTGQTVWLSIVNADGSVPTLRFSGNPKAYLQLRPTNEQAEWFIAHTRSIRSMRAGDGTPVHAQSVPLKDGTFLAVGLPTHEVQKTLRQLILLELGIGIAAVALAAGLTSWGVRRGLRPLHRVTRTAQEVTAELGPDGSGLERRVPNADPATEVGQVASSVNTLLQAVEAEFAARLRNEERMRQFLADASHELRTPLTSIRGYAELSRLQGNSTGSSDDPMRRIEVEGTRMSRLVEDLLVLARGDQGNPMYRERVEIDPVLSEAASAAESAHPDRQITVVASGGAAVIGDRDQLLRLLLNLLTNAAVHTAPDGPILLEAIQGRTPAGPAVAIRVIDQGPGLPPEEAAHVFERFWRADKARTRSKGGSGLGLAIVAQIVESHGGSVRFESAVESGTTVTIMLPLATAIPTAD